MKPDRGPGFQDEPTIWAQDVPVNLAMQAGKRSRFMPEGIYGPLETTLTQFNAWLLRAYRSSAAPRAAQPMMRVAGQG